MFILGLQPLYLTLNRLENFEILLSAKCHSVREHGDHPRDS
jgi:hypothetical protein